MGLNLPGAAATLPVSLLHHKSGECLPLMLETSPATAESVIIEFQFGAAQQQALRFVRLLITSRW